VIPTRHQRIGGLAAASLLAIALVPATAGAGAGASATTAAAKKPVKKNVEVADYYYGPAKETIPKGSTLTWVWPDAGGDSHDVQFGTGPKGAKKFASEIATAGYTFKHTFKVAGKYHIICSLHDEMTMDVVVR
jgi:plastocyanin